MGMSLPTPAQLAQLAKLKAEFRMKAEMEKRKAQAIANAERQAGKGVGLETDKKAKGGLEKFLKKSKIKQRVYHGTGANVMDFKPSRIGAMGPGVYVTTDPEVASGYANVVNNRREQNNPNVLPLHIQARNPFTISHVNKSHDELFKHFDPEGKLTDEQVIELVKKAGHDAIHAIENGEINMLDPRRIKSAIGNRGTYDPNDPDITKATGGSIPSQDVMRLAIGGQGPRNFLKGSVEKIIEPLKSKGATEADRAWFEQRAAQHPEEYRRAMETIPRTEAINQWIERNLGNYIRKQMGHPNDPIRKLAEEGILHFDPEALGIDEESAEDRRKMMGGEKLGKGALAQAWENAADTRFEPNTVEDVLKMPDIYKGMQEPWMEKADPKTPLYELYAANELGFDHIVDVLKQDLAEGRIRPEQLNKVSIEQAVRRAHEYDKERKKVMAETALKATEGMPVHKDYGNGFKWIELTKPEKGKHLLTDLDRRIIQQRQENNPVPQELMDKTLEQRAMQKLEDALKYEGDTMGHCVGGYCPDVASGKKRIFSLRDEKNEPHVTVEVKPNQHLDYNSWFRKQPEEIQNRIAQRRMEDRNHNVYEGPEYLAAREALLPRINQIKGKGNAKPKKDYIPYVQDFVKSGKWSDVGDLLNADLYHVHPESDVAKNLSAAGEQVPTYVTNYELAAINKRFRKAEGGEVDAETVFMGKGGSTIKNVEEYLRQREGEYGVKRLQRAADEIPHLERMYTEDALRRAFGGDNAKTLMTMDPALFERYALRLHHGDEQLEHDANTIPVDYVKGLPDMTQPQYIRHLARIKGGFSDVPFLEIGRRKPEYLPSIEGHEGRHRSRALTKKKVQKSLVQLIPTGAMREPMPRRYREDFIEAMKRELGEKRLVTPEGRSLLPADLTAMEHQNLERRGLLEANRPQLPEIYKDGGDVDPESCFFPNTKE
jgi:ADP-Ribosyltransferase in polyvalent proteins/PcfJ-like protein